VSSSSSAFAVAQGMTMSQAFGVHWMKNRILSCKGSHTKGSAGGARRAGHGTGRRAGNCRKCGDRGEGAIVKSDAYPMHCAPRCTAKSKRSGNPCQAPAVRGWTVCRMHGARGGAKSGAAHPNWQHGGRSGESVELRKLVNMLGRESRKLSGKPGEPGEM
jgi:hypothetical protein